MARGRKPASVARGTIFVLAESMVKADEWAAAHGIGKDKYRYVVNADVFDVMGPNDTYAYVAGFDQAGSRYIELSGIVRDRDLEHCGKDAYILDRDPQTGRVPRVVEQSS